MKSGFFVLLLALSMVVPGQEKVILDTDPSYDPDDAGCMAMLHNMASLGECQILAIINSTNHKESALAISAINHFYNRGAIPVGDYKGYSEKINAPANTYDGAIARRYPRSVKTWEETIDGVALYREILGSATDKSITVVIIGTMHNFYGLLQSEADEFSRLSGKQLVKQKVKQVVTMGGNFIDGKGLDRTNWGGADALCSYTDWSCLNKERNRMCRYVINNCEAPFIASGWEVGCGDYHEAGYGNVMTGQGLKRLDQDHIIRKSYEFHFDHRGGSERITRHSNDQCALHYAIRGEGENYVAKTNGNITLTTSGECLWEEAQPFNQGYIQKKRDKDLIAEEIEELMMGEALPKDQTPASTPQGISVEKLGSSTKITWNPSVDETPGSWVIGYDVYLDQGFVKRVFGTSVTIKSTKGLVTIKSVNVSGIVSEGGEIVL